MEQIFDRTACFMKEPMKDGRFRIRRIPWDLIAYGYGNGLLVSPIPFKGNMMSDVTTDTTINDIEDLLAGGEGKIDEVIGIEWFDSEAAFYAKFDGTFGYYQTDDNQSAEFGYPKVHPV